MLTVPFRDQRPGPGWHAHGTTSKDIVVFHDGHLISLRIEKQRWLHVETGTTRHDRPFWDRPRGAYGVDLVVLCLAAWLLGNLGLHHARWPWADQERPARRTVQRWARHLAPHAEDWLQATREAPNVASRLEENLPAGGIPPPGGCSALSQENVLWAGKLRDVIWSHERAARVFDIPMRSFLCVTRWRWPTNSPTAPTLTSP